VIPRLTTLLASMTRYRDSFNFSYRIIILAQITSQFILLFDLASAIRVIRYSLCTNTLLRACSKNRVTKARVFCSALNRIQRNIYCFSVIFPEPLIVIYF
jgi:hypothetical protein